VKILVVWDSRYILYIIKMKVAKCSEALVPNANLHGVTSWKNKLFINTAVTAFNLAYFKTCLKLIRIEFFFYF
jgi:hypothetical protein